MFVNTLAPPFHPFPIVLALGGNLGPPRETLERACTLLARAGIRICRRSRLYWTRPWGVTDQPPFLNAAVSVQTALRPLELLARCQGVENELGRRRERHWGPRRIDLDLLLYGSLSLRHPSLTLPHPQIARRDFVLAPLADLGVPPVAAVDPRSWSGLLADLPADQRTIIRSAPWPSWPGLTSCPGARS